jgi:type I restriction enzyme R subunit
VEIVRFSEDLDLSTLGHHEVEEYPTENGFADYGLFVKGKLLGIIEAKKVTVAPQNVLEQAKRYAKDIYQGVGNWVGYRVPFLFASNGETIWYLEASQEEKWQLHKSIVCLTQKWCEAFFFWLTAEP